MLTEELLSKYKSSLNEGQLNSAVQELVDEVSRVAQEFADKYGEESHRPILEGVLLKEVEYKLVDRMVELSKECSPRVMLEFSFMLAHAKSRNAFTKQ